VLYTQVYSRADDGIPEGVPHTHQLVDIIALQLPLICDGVCQLHSQRVSGEGRSGVSESAKDVAVPLLSQSQLAGHDISYCTCLTFATSPRSAASWES
jgi:hypothetical protein